MRDFGTGDDGADWEIVFPAENGRQANVVGDVVKASQNVAHLRGHLLMSLLSPAALHEGNIEMSMVGGAVRVGLDESHFGKPDDPATHLGNSLSGLVQRSP